MLNVVRSCVDAAFPRGCLQCDRLFGRDAGPRSVTADVKAGESGFESLMADHLCPACTGRFEPIHGPLCTICGVPFDSEQGVDHTCPRCSERDVGFASARAAGRYHQPLKTVLQHYKYMGRTELAGPLGALLWDALRRFYDPEAMDAVLPVPLHWGRKFKRGYNQARLLLRQWPELARRQGTSFGREKLLFNVLQRSRRTAAQTGLGRRRRMANLKGAFRVRSGDVLQGKRLLLVDDVLTTGATAQACAAVLRDAGASSVHVLTVARAD